MVAAAVVAVLGCASCRGAGVRSAEGTLNVAIPAMPLTLDPRLASDAEGDKIASLLCDGLMIKNERLELVPNLAEEVEKLSETSYRFHLREGIRFHDGTPLTADDVVFTFRSIIDGKIASPFKGSYEWIREIIAESPREVRIDLKEPYGPFLTRLTLGIVSKAAAEKLGDGFGRAPVCAGPYAFVQMTSDAFVELKANADYFGDGPKMKRLVFHVVKDDNVRVLKLIKGDIDLVQNAVPPLLLEGLKKNPQLAVVDDVGIVMGYLGMNLTDPILADPRVRRAIAFAIDRDAIIAHRWRGLAVKANSVLSPGNWAYDDDLPQIPYDPAKAAALLDEAGYPDPDGAGKKPRFKLLFKTSTVKERVDIARMIAEQLKAVGIDARVVPYEWATFFRDVRRGNFQLYSLSWVGITEPDIFYEVFHSSQLPPAGLNRGRYRNPEVDELVAAGRVTMDDGKRREIYAKVQRILLDDLPIVPLWYEKNVAVYRKGLEGVVVYPDASYRAFMGIEKR